MSGEKRGGVEIKNEATLKTLTEMNIEHSERIEELEGFRWSSRRRNLKGG